MNNIKNYEFKPGLQQEVEIIDMANLYATFSDTLTIAHRTEFYHILWFQEGTPVHMVDFNHINIVPNTIVFLNKGMVHKFDSNGKFNGKVILFTDNFFCRTADDINYLNNSILFNDFFSVSQVELRDNIPEIMAELIHLMDTELNNKKDQQQSEILKNLLHNILLICERQRRVQNFTEIKKNADFDYVMLYRDQIDKNFRTQKLVAAYAEQLSVTERRLNQATTKVLGKTPKQMIDNRVMLEAKRLLLHSSVSVKEIGFNLGFEEPTNFIKYFKKHNNSTPMEFRESFSR